ncbi:YfcE family phosphodiesterase [Alkalibacterium sp. AK22]|uniref:YfcE family phosphodiesterase n=1 Tax=Alkalibacterium sp. AK22 TaxID=1229520 RepID=UPI000550FAF8|nr:metallophosphoesterase [Alkalibacterium sp. AK22]
MKLIVVSDNHGNAYYMEEILSIYEDEAPGWIHCGDSELPEDHPLWQNYKTVEGNMDYAKGIPLELVRRIEDKTMLVVHGHKHAVKQSYQKLKSRADEEQATFVFYGHTHIAKVEQEDGIFFINPGSLTQPRDRERGTYLVMDYNPKKHTVQFTYFDQDHNELSDLSKQFDVTA